MLKIINARTLTAYCNAVFFEVCCTRTVTQRTKPFQDNIGFQTK